MKHAKHGTILTITALLCTLGMLLSGCAQTQVSSSTATSTSTGGATITAPGLTTVALDSSVYAGEDVDASWDESTSTVITLSGSSIKTKGSGATVSGSTVTITQAGTYVLRGTLDDGQVIVDAGSEDLVRLVLDGATLHCSTSAPIHEKQSDKLVVILADGSHNTLTDAAEYVYVDGEDEPDAALFAKHDLAITGTGSLDVTGNYNNAIGTRDDLRITGGTISVTAVNDGLRGRDSVAVASGTITIDAQNDGIKSNYDTDEEKGWIILNGGTFDIAAGHDAVQAQTTLLVTGGSYTIYTGGGAASAPQKQSDPRWGGGGETPSTDDETGSMKALKAGVSLTIEGGDFTIDAQDDAVHANGDVTMTGGSLSIKTGDDGFHADNALTIDGGTIVIETCYEGLEGSTVDVNGGDISIVSSDDGINSAGGSDGETTGPGGRDMFMQANDDLYIRITGGVIRITAGYDGLDSNGNIFIDGGELYVSGAGAGSVGGDGAIDCDGTFTITGGTVVAMGGTAFAVLGAGGNSINASGTQPVLNFQFTDTQVKGAVIELTDASGGVLISYTADKDFKTIAFSSPAMQDGESYTVSVDGAEVYTVALSGMMTSITDKGEAVNANGMGDMGGGRPGGGDWQGGQMPDGFTLPDGMEFPDDFTPPDGMEFPDGFTPPDGTGGQRPGRDTQTTTP